jgi:hypothetical protein
MGIQIVVKLFTYSLMSYIDFNVVRGMYSIVFHRTFLSLDLFPSETSLTVSDGFKWGCMPAQFLVYG